MGLSIFQSWVEEEFVSDMGEDINRVSNEEIEFYLTVLTEVFPVVYQMILDSAASDWFDTDDLIQMRRDMESVDDYLDSKIHEQFRMTIKTAIQDIEEYREDAA